MKNYDVIKNVQKVLNYSSTGFLNKNLSIKVKEQLKCDEYKEYFPYKDADKTIIYNPYIDLPRIKLFKIICKTELMHRSILGSLFSLNISETLFGDIIKFDNNWYFYVLDNISEYIISNIYMIDNYPVSFEEMPLDYLENFEREYDTLEYITSSLRIDNVISKIISKNRDTVKMMILNKDILVNYESDKKASSNLKLNDVLSIRKHGKYIFKSILGKTKKDNYIIQILKYK